MAHDLTDRVPPRQPPPPRILGRSGPVFTPHLHHNPGSSDGAVGVVGQAVAKHSLKIDLLAVWEIVDVDRHEDIRVAGNRGLTRTKQNTIHRALTVSELRYPYYLYSGRITKGGRHLIID